MRNSNFKAIYFVLIFLLVLISSKSFSFDNLNLNYKTIVIGDLHGDLEAFLSILKERKLIDANGKWIAQNTELIILGDYHDRGPDTRYIMDYFFELKPQIEAANGKFYTVVGNHEVLVTMANLSYVSKEELESFEGFARPKLNSATRPLFESHIMQARRSAGQAFAPIVELPDGRKVRVTLPDKPRKAVEGFVSAHFNGSKYSKWVFESDAMLKRGNSLFVHGGITDWALNFSYQEVNNLIKSWMAFFQGISPKPEDEDSAWVLGDEGPLWDRTMAMNELDGDLVNQIIKSLGVKRVIVGHTPKETVESLYKGQVLTIDTGNSKYYGGAISVIEIDSKDSVSEFYIERQTEPSSLYLKLVCKYRVEQGKSCYRK